MEFFICKKKKKVDIEKNSSTNQNSKPDEGEKAIFFNDEELDEEAQDAIEKKDKAKTSVNKLLESIEKRQQELNEEERETFLKLSEKLKSLESLSQNV